MSFHFLSFTPSWKRNTKQWRWRKPSPRRGPRYGALLSVIPHQSWFGDSVVPLHYSTFTCQNTRKRVKRLLSNWERVWHSRQPQCRASTMRGLLQRPNSKRYIEFESIKFQFIQWPSHVILKTYFWMAGATNPCKITKTWPKEESWKFI